MTFKSYHLLNFLKLAGDLFIEIFWGLTYCAILLVWILTYQITSGDLKFTRFESIHIGNESFLDIGKSEFSIIREGFQPKIIANVNQAVLRDDKNNVCAQIPHIEAKLNPFKWMYGFEGLVENIFLEKPDVKLAIAYEPYDAHNLTCHEGRFVISKETLQEWVKNDSSTSMQLNNHRYGIKDGSIDLISKLNNESLYFHDIDLNLYLDEFWLYQLGFKVLHKEEQFDLKFQGDYDQTRKQVSHNKILFDKLPTPIFSIFHPSFDFLEIFQIPFSGEVNFALNQDLNIDTISFDIFSSDGGAIQTDKIAQYLSSEDQRLVERSYAGLFDQVRLFLNSVKFKGDFNVAEGKYHFDNLEIDFYDGIYINPLSDKPIPLESIKTSLTWFQSSNRALLHKSWLTFSGQSFEVSRVYKNPITLILMTFTGWVDLKHNQLSMSDIYLDFQGPAMQSKLSLFKTDDGYAFTTEGSVLKIDVDDLPQLWPRDKGVNARDWVVENILDGEISRLDYRLAFSMDKEFTVQDFEQVTVRGWLRDMEVAYLDPLPHVTNVDAFMILTQDDAKFFIDKGDIGPLKLDTSNVFLTNFNDDIQFAEIWVTVDGKLKDYFDFINQKPLEILEDYPKLKNSPVKGTAKTLSHFKFPLLKDLYFRQIQMDVEGEARNASVGEYFKGFFIDDADFAFLIDETKLSANGQAHVNSIPVQFNWLESIDKKLTWQTKLKLNSLFNIKKLKVLGDDILKYFNGSVHTKANLEIDKKENISISTSIDTTKLGFDFDFLSLSKKPGEASKLQANLLINKQKKVTAKNIEFLSGNIQLNAELLAQFREELEVDFLKLHQLKFDKTNLSGEFSFQQETPVVNVRADYVDFSQYLKRSGESSESFASLGIKSPVNMSIKIDTLGMARQLQMQNFQFKGIRSDDIWLSMEASGAIQNHQHSLSLNRTIPNGYLKVISQNLGQLLKAANITNEIHGGELAIYGQFSGQKAQSPFNGTVVLNQYRLGGVPSFLKLINAAAIAGIQDLGQKGVLFEHLTAKIRYINDTFHIVDGRTAGGSMGITFEGIIEYISKKINIKGVIVPAYAINGIFSHIPILGNVLAGEKGEGVIGINYKVYGHYDNPGVEVNPLSILTPGFLRKIFGQ